MFTVLFMFILFRTSKGVIYKLNESDYDLMPPMFHLDPYEECYDDPYGLYCTVDLTLVSDEPSPLLIMIQEYSAHVTHYNHTRLRHGICVTRTCKKFYQAEQDLRWTLEACANESLFDKYKLKARVSDGFDCSKRDKNTEIDYVDLTVAGICVLILFANIVGSICDYWFFRRRKCVEIYRFVNCFSIFRNWKNLVSSTSEDCNPRLPRLRGLHGIRVVNACFVVIGHASLISLVLTDNPDYIENLFMTTPFHILLNATMIMQTFLLISSYVLIHKCLISTEKREISGRMLPKLLLVRWFRLTPAYAVILALTATWFGRFTSGPHWKKFIFSEMSDCRRYWWRHLLYINNYFDQSECMIQSWYLAADTQLFCIAVIVFVTCKTPRARKWVLSVLFVAGLIIPAAHTYFQNLDGVLIISPESILTVFTDSRTFNEVYRKSHTNLTGYVMGMAIACLIYDWQRASGNPKNLQKYRYVVWLSFPLACLCCYSGSIFYREAPPLPTYVHLLFAALMKPIFCIFISIFLVGVILRVEGLYRGVLEWPGWVPPSRLSFSAYLLHPALIRNYLAMQVTTTRTNIFQLVLQSLSVLLTTFIAAFFFWILVEAPFRNLVREYLGTVKQRVSGGAQETGIDSTNKEFDRTGSNKIVNKIIAKMQ